MIFVGEEGADMGGPTREFFRLIRRGMGKYLEQTGSFKHDSMAYQVYISPTTIMYLFNKCYIYRKMYSCDLESCLECAWRKEEGHLVYFAHLHLNFYVVQIQLAYHQALRKFRTQH